MPSCIEFDRWTTSGCMSVEQPVDELFEFLALVAGFAAEHRDGHVAELASDRRCPRGATAASSRAG